MSHQLANDKFLVSYSCCLQHPLRLLHSGQCVVHLNSAHPICKVSYSCVGDESNALESASVRKSHDIQVLYFTTEAPILTNGIHLRHRLRHVKCHSTVALQMTFTTDPWQSCMHLSTA